MATVALTMAICSSAPRCETPRRSKETPIYGTLILPRLRRTNGALEQTLDGRHTVISAADGKLWPNAPGINILDNSLQNPMAQQASLDLQWLLTNNLTASAGYLHNFGSHTLLGRNLGAVFNPLAGGLDREVNLESSGKTKYDALNLSVEKRLAGRWHLLANYTLSKSFNYASRSKGAPKTAADFDGCGFPYGFSVT
jgi:hypothetical protein